MALDKVSTVWIITDPCRILRQSAAMGRSSMPNSRKQIDIHRESWAGKPALRAAACRARSAVGSSTKSTTHTKNRGRRGEDRNRDDRNMGNHGFALAGGGIPVARHKPVIAAGHAPVGPRAPILTDSDHPSRKECVLSKRLTTSVYACFFRGGKKVISSQWRESDALEVAKNGLENE